MQINLRGDYRAKLSGFRRAGETAKDLLVMGDGPGLRFHIINSKGHSLASIELEGNQIELLADWLKAKVAS